MGAVDLDGHGEVGERSAGPSLRLGQGHDGQAHLHDGVPQHRIEAGGLGLAHSLAGRFLGVEAGGGLPQRVLIRGEGEVHEPLLSRF